MILTFYNNFSIGSWIFFIFVISQNECSFNFKVSKSAFIALSAASRSIKKISHLIESIFTFLNIPRPQHCLYRDLLTLSWKQHFRKKSRLSEKRDFDDLTYYQKQISDLSCWKKICFLFCKIYCNIFFCFLHVL